MSAIRRLAVRVVLGLLLVAPPLAGELRADDGELRSIGRSRSAGPARTAAARKIVSRLRAVAEEIRAEGLTTANAAGRDVAQRFSSPALRVDDAARVHVDVTVTDASEAGLAVLRGHGLDVELVNGQFGIVEGWIPAANLEALAAEPVVVIVRPPSYATRRVGSVNSQGTAIHRCDQAQASGVTGAGVRVGVISDGVDGLAASQATGNLAAVQVLSAGSGDEGTAMLEIVHDCAPGASLSFHTGFPTALAFVAAVNNLRAAGAKIIVDDLGFFSEPFFQDGVIAQNDRAVSPFALRVSAAGNSRRDHYAGTFTPGPFDPEIPGRRHLFGGADSLLRFRAPAGGVATFILQWGDPFGASGNDYDLCIRSGNGTLVDCSLDIQDGNEDPIEAVSVSCSGAPGSFCAGDVQITLFAGAPRPLKMFCLGDCIMDEFVVAAGSIIGHPAVPDVLAVAASPAGNPTVIEPFSSAGPVEILFPAAEVRNKPDITGTDGVTTSRPGFSPFFGTSAAAPHVAAVAALVAQVNPGFTPPQIAARLKQSAINLGPAGFDFDSGFGRADAVKAIVLLPFDFDGKDDIAIYRGSTGQWLGVRSSGGIADPLTWGNPALLDIPISRDFDGDGQGDIAVYRGSTGQWFLLLSGGGGLTLNWGEPAQQDVPLAADFDGDGRADITVYRGLTGQWFVLRSGGGAQILTWGVPALLDTPVPADFDGDGRADFAVYRRSTGQWFVLLSGGGAITLTWGDPAQQDMPVPGYYDGDARADFAVYRGSTGQWFVLLSGGGAIILTWGDPSRQDVPVPADYDGDGRTDIAVWRRADGNWFIIRSAGGVSIVNTGVPLAGDQPVPLRRR